MGADVNGFELIGELSANNAGFCRWGFCRRDGREFFIKEFLSPVYPADDADLSPTIIERKRRVCDEFFMSKKAFYDALYQCRSGNNVLVEAFFRSGSKYYIVSDKVVADGTDPAMIAALSPERKMALTRALLYSVSVLHAHGVVHADLKPNNILLKKTRSGYYTAKIIDFDSGFLRDKVPSDVQGDFIYLAPEAYLKMNEEDVELNEKIDVFALGILLHQYWTGETPRIPGEYRYAFEAVLDDQMLELSGGIPAEVRYQIKRMLLLDPAERPSAEEVLDALRPKIEAPVQPVVPRRDPEVTEQGRSVSGPKRSPGFYVPEELD